MKDLYKLFVYAVFNYIFSRLLAHENPKSNNTLNQNLIHERLIKH